MPQPHYRPTDALNDLAALLANRWVALPLILLLSAKVALIAPATLIYLVPLLLLTVLFSIRTTALLAIRAYQTELRNRQDSRRDC